MAIDSALGRLGIKQGVCTSSTRPTNPFEGQVIYESDTNRTLVYDNAAWVVVADNQVLSIDATNSRVGIGTTSPAKKLHVKGDDEGIRIEDGGATDHYDIYRNDTTGHLEFTGSQTSFSGYDFDVNNGTNVMRIANSGNVGIGTTSPADKLHVEFDDGASSGIVITNSGNTVGKQGMRLAFDNDRLTIQRASDSGTFEANYVLINQDSGNVDVLGDMTVGGQAYTRANWCAMSGPRTFKSAYWNTWYQIAWNTGASGSVVCYPHIDTGLLEYDGIEIFREGHFLVEYSQRNNGGTYSAYGGIGESGSRVALAGVNHDRGTDGIWSHDHQENHASFVHSYFIGRLYVGDIVTAGPANSTNASNFLFANGNYAGYLSVIYLGDHDGT